MRLDSRVGVGRSALVAMAVVALVAALAVAGAWLGPQKRPSGNQTSSTGSSVSTTLEAIIGGAYHTASDKSGTGGVTVTVKDLEVLYVSSESDGDWHVAVNDGRVAVFITEIIPSYQASEGRPAQGSIIDETGVPYCDRAHQTESWHGDTCWEIHPVTSWQVSGESFNRTVTQPSNHGTNVTISYTQNPIARGNDQTVTVWATDSDGPIQDTLASVEVTYASGATVHTFSCTTDGRGACAVTWLIGGNSDSGTFQVVVTVNGLRFYSSFEVTS